MPSSPRDDSLDEPQTHSKVLAGLFLLIALLIGADVLVDALEGVSFSHVFVELVVVATSFVGVGLLARDLRAFRAHGQALSRELAKSHRDAARYKAEAAELLRGLSAAIEEQLEQWGLTEAEREVAILLLKGLSHKEVADVRGTSEKTARKQALTLYKKAGLEGRAALSAFFLEDLLPARPA